MISVHLHLDFIIGLQDKVVSKYTMTEKHNSISVLRAMVSTGTTSGTSEEHIRCENVVVTPVLQQCYISISLR